MKAVLLGSDGKLLLAEVPKPVAGKGEVLVKLRCCGVCGTDLEKVHGHGITSRILGHEEVGVVDALGEGMNGLAVGDRVYAHHHVPCGSCELCVRGEQTLCPEYSKHNLVPCGLADYFIVPSYNVERGAVLKLPDELGFEEASFIEPLSCCVRGLARAGAERARSVLIYGAGPVGLLHLKLLKAQGGKTVAMADVSDHRLELAARLGADRTFNPAGRDASVGSQATAPDLVILATGSASAFEDAMKSVGKGGTVLLFGAPRRGAGATMDMARFFLNGTRLVTSYASTEAETAEALELLAEKRVVVSDLITHRFPLSRAEEAFSVAGQQMCMKALITA